jgi:hypothetical protein
VCAKRVGRNMRSKIKVPGGSGAGSDLARRREAENSSEWLDENIWLFTNRDTEKSSFCSWLFSCDSKCKNGRMRYQMAGSDPTVEDCRLLTGLAVVQGHGRLASGDFEDER